MTLKQRLFVQKYIKYGNATRAAYDIYNVKRRNSAAVIGSRLLRNVNVQREIDFVIEAERSIPTSIALLLKDMLENGTWRAKVEALKMAMRIHGY